MSKRANTAAVVRDGTQYIFTASGFTGGNNSIVQLSSYGGRGGQQSTIQVDGRLIQSVSNTPIAASLVWDNSQINVYYLAPAAHDTATIHEICQRGDDGWIEGSLTQWLKAREVVAHPDSGLAVWTEGEIIRVFFRSSENSDHELSVAAYLPEANGWELDVISF